MFMLRDDKGRAVVFKSFVRVSDDEARTRTEEKVFLAKQGDELEPVTEAAIEEGDDVFLDEAYVKQVLEDNGFSGPFELLKEEGCRVRVPMESAWDESFRGPSTQRHVVGGRRVPKEEFDRLAAIVSELNSFDRLTSRWGVQLRGGEHLGFQQAMELIGVGQTVTAESLCQGRAKGEDRPRLLPGDAVLVDVRGGPVQARVTKMAAKVHVLTKDGRKASYPYAKVSRDDSAPAVDDSPIPDLDPSLAEAMDFVKAGSGRRIYRTRTEKGKAVFPAFPDEEKRERQVALEDAATCKCPVCGWTMADFDNCGEFLCSFCRIRGMVLRQDGGEVSLFMYRMPAKNRFATKEARCCANCGLFQFESGRQGKRSTGYCRYSNQCLQAYNVCDYWFPRDPERYGSNMRQHVTNLGYGVDDRRNTGRNDIRDTVYRAEDHEFEKARVEKVKTAYAVAYERMLVALAEAGKKAGECDSEEWKRRLDDGC